MITIVNRDYTGSDAIYCGRGTPLGNPFPMKNESHRNYVCVQYEKWFKTMLGNSTKLKFIAAIEEIYQAALKGDVKLKCWCAPKRCHCDTIKHHIDDLIIKRKLSNETDY